MSTITLTERQRTIFDLAARTIHANPFSLHRQEIDAEIAALHEGDSLEENLRHEHNLVGQTLRDALGKQGNLHSLASDQDLNLALYAILFDVFHRHATDFDALIDAQITAGKQPVQVPFAQTALDTLRSYGLKRSICRRYFGMFYQMRRAYRFISTTLLGDSPSMRALRERLWWNIFTHDLRLYESCMWSRLEDFSTFLLGATGTGKGTAAAALGRSGWIPYDENTGTFATSFTTSFLPINLSQFTPSLIESELFGHKKGAFTGAVKSHQGILGQCPAYGAVFLDELGEVEHHIQIKLLNVLQDRAFFAVGDRKHQRFEGRIIAATNRTIEELLEQNKLRSDLFYRLCSDIIEVPTLSTRIQQNPNELSNLVTHITTRLVGQPHPQLVHNVLRTLDENLAPDYPWPGNVRELEQCVRRIILTHNYTPPPLTQAPPQEVSPMASQLATQFENGDFDIKTLTALYCKHLYELLGTYEAVATRTGLDRRTAKKYISMP